MTSPMTLNPPSLVSTAPVLIPRIYGHRLFVSHPSRRCMNCRGSPSDRCKKVKPFHAMLIYPHGGFALRLRRTDLRTTPVASRSRVPRGCP